MMFWFLEYNAGKEQRLEKFCTPERLWQRLAALKDILGEWPPDLCIYKGDCLFDGG